MKKLVVIIALGVWVLCGCQAVRDYQAAINDPILNAEIITAQNRVVGIVDNAISLLSASEANHPVAVLAGSFASLIVGIILGRKKRKAGD